MHVRPLVRSVVHRPFVLALLSGALVLAAFYVPFAWPLVFLALTPLFFAIRKAQGPWHAFFVGTLCGALISGGTSFWYFSSVSLIPEAGPLLGFLGIAACWTAMTIALAPATGLFTLLVYIIPDSRMGYLVMPLAWIASEYMRLYGFLFVTFAPGVGNPPFYSTGFLSYPLADSSAWLQLASMGGIYLMSFVAAASAYAFYRFKRLPRKKAVLTSLVLASALLLFSVIPVAYLREHLGSPPETVPVRAGLMSIHLSEEEQTIRYKDEPRFKELVAQSVKDLAVEDPQIILLPEGGRFFTAKQDAPLVGPIVIDVLVGGTSYGTVENAAFAGTVEGERVTPIRAKRILTPQGEYLISLASLVAPLVGLQKEAAVLARNYSVHTASWGTAVTIPNVGVKASVLFCIEIIAPWFGADIAHEQGTDLLLVLISQGRFRHPYSLEVDTLRFLKVRAVEADRPLIASADHALAYALDQFGRVQTVLGKDHLTEDRVIEIDVPMHE